MQVQAASTTLVQTSNPQAEAQVRAAMAGAEAVTSTKAVAQTEAASENRQDRQPSVQESVKKLNETIAAFNRSVQFTIDDETRQSIVKIVDVSSKEIIRQIPSQDVIEIARAIDKLKGLLLTDKA